jgi:hypothetical protein
LAADLGPLAARDEATHEQNRDQRRRGSRAPRSDPSRRRHEGEARRPEALVPLRSDWCYTVEAATPRIKRICEGFRFVVDEMRSAVGRRLRRRPVRFIQGENGELGGGF